MIKKHIHRFIFLLSAVTSLCAAQEKPNILFIIADDQSWETVGAVGDLGVKTPNLDRLVHNGVSFRHAYNMGAWGGAVCASSRNMFNTGRSVWACQPLFQAARAKWGKPVKAAGKSWSQLLSDAGYHTYFTGKWHAEIFRPQKVFDTVGTVRGGMPKQTPEGYNRPIDEEDYRTGWKPWDTQYGGFWEGGKHWSEIVRDEAIGFIKQASKADDPFFMYIAFNAAHDPRQAPKEYVDMYPLDKIKVPENFLPNYPYAKEIGCDPNKLRDERLMPSPRTEFSVKVNRQEYYACITHMDAQIGAILDALEQSGKLDNTYIFYTADHGLAVGHHGLAGKQNMYEHSIGAPLIINGPGLEKGKRINTRVYIQDIMPSTLELAGAAIPKTVEFESLMPLAGGQTDKGRETIYGAYMETQRCAIKDAWKVIYYPKAAVYRLYQLDNDPQEMNDLAGNPEYSDTLKRMKRVLENEMKRMNDPLTEK